MTLVECEIFPLGGEHRPIPLVGTDLLSLSDTSTFTTAWNESRDGKATAFDYIIGGGYEKTGMINGTAGGSRGEEGRQSILRGELFSVRARYSALVLKAVVKGFKDQDMQDFRRKVGKDTGTQVKAVYFLYNMVVKELNASTASRTAFKR